MINSNKLYSLENMRDIAMHAYSNEYELSVTDIQRYDNVYYFIITCDYDLNNSKSYIIYQINEEIYYRPVEEFQEILKYVDINGEEGLVRDINDTDKLLDYVDADDSYSCTDLINTILETLGISTRVDESIKVRRPKLGSDGDFEKSKKVDDILHGDEEQRNFEKEVEKETQKAGVENPLATPPQQDGQMESFHQVLPNVHNAVTESKSINEKVEDMEIIYEPKDWVIIKETGMRAQVNDVVTNGDGKITMLTILASNGIMYDAEPNEIKPDPMYIDNIPGREINGGSLNVPSYANFDINPDTRLPYPVKNDTPTTLADLNGKTVQVYITNEGYRITDTPYIASLEDVINGKQYIRVINESNKMEEYDLHNNIEFAEMPYAVVVDSNGKPVRSVQIDPMSYVNTDEDGLVNCRVDGKMTKLPKKCLDMLS